ncbi:MAG: 2,3-bisphosphoglycerate-independent phosphoglycerate mutase [Spirochaetota bacterium]|nr:MAG: 2,3-bisphosphoglycerate-independent phosphoglycerate mutase [Spirochaetota bacterium]
MEKFDLIKQLKQPSSEKIVLLVMDGLGGLAKQNSKKDDTLKGTLTELEAAHTPNLDTLAKASETGLMVPILPGITPGSGPGHLALFGYDPLQYIIGRGILSALGVKFPVQDGDLCARVNFATVDTEGKVTDRRAGRIKDEINRKMCEKLATVGIGDVQYFIETEKEHRAALIFRGREMSDQLSETDPQTTGVPPLPVRPLDNEKVSKATADMINNFIKKVAEKLKDEHPANMILLRGWALHKKIPSFEEIYGLDACAIAGYPMYRGLASLAGMDVIDVESGVVSQFEKLKEIWGTHEFYFVHIKYTDSAGEDGDFDRKVSVIEEVDQNIPTILNLEPDVLAVTADHSTPASYKAHSWHSFPLLIKSRWSRMNREVNFGETDLTRGTLGIINSVDLMPLLMAHSGRLAKFGA